MPRFRPHWIYSVTGLVCLLLAGSVWFLRPFINRVPDTTARPIEVGSQTAASEPMWPQLRGPTFDSHSSETGLAETWPDEGPPVLWTRELGQGYSGFIAVGSRVFTLTQTLYRQSLVCLDAETGETIWTHHYGWPYEGGGLYPGPRSTPTWYKGRLYFAAPDGTIACVEAEHGTPLWSCNPKKSHHGKGTDFGYASSPVIIDNRLIVPVGGLDASVVALDPADGSELWASGESPASYATPLPITWRGRSLVVTPLENSIAAFDVATGTHQWEVEFSEGYDEHSAAPLYQEPFLVVSSPFRSGAKQFHLVPAPSDKRLEAARDQANQPQKEVVEAKNHNPPDETIGLRGEPAGGVVSESMGQPVVVWDTPKFSNDVASSVLVDGRIYGFDLKDPQSRLDRPSKGEFRCLDFQTGRIIWSTTKVGQANLIFADEKLILFTDSGELILARAGTDEYSELDRTQVFRDEICWTYPALHHGCVFVRTQTRAACLYLGKTEIQSKRRVQSVQDIPRGKALDAKWLIGGEREFPAAVPDLFEFRIWYQWSLAGLLLASIASLISSVVTRSSVTISRAVFWLTTLLAGAVGSPIINSRQNDYVLLWPLVLWAVFQLTINAITWTERSTDQPRNRWFSRGCGVLFMGTCLRYFHLCRSLGYAIEWSFLVGFLPAFAVAAVAARFLTSRPRFWPAVDLVLATLSFSTYFWSSVLFIKWKLVVGS